MKVRAFFAVAVFFFVQSCLGFLLDLMPVHSQYGLAFQTFVSCFIAGVAGGFVARHRFAPVAAAVCAVVWLAIGSLSATIGGYYLTVAANLAVFAISSVIGAKFAEHYIVRKDNGDMRAAA